MGDDGQRVRIEVSDTGEGIPVDALERIFEPFVQVGRSSQDAASSGAGLGLAISREFAASMQGSLTANNAEQGGAVFVLELPAVVSERAGAVGA
jgi:two-component system C4-dicarboxylate transport sensor histidine kinase DctB